MLSLNLSSLEHLYSVLRDERSELNWILHFTDMPIQYNLVSSWPDEDSLGNVQLQFSHENIPFPLQTANSIQPKFMHEIKIYRV